MAEDALEHLTVTVRQARPDEDPLLAEHFLRTWADNNVPAEWLRPESRERVVAFIEQARRQLCYCGFIAELRPNDATTAARIAGSANCQLVAGLYPDVFESRWRRYGYIWGVYVDSRVYGERSSE